MKKIFFSALAVLSLAACMQEAVVETPQGGAIAFENAFVGNATRAAVIDNTNLNAFQVWGYVNSPEGTVFDGNVVSNETGAWEYTGGTQYWAPNNNYVFAAVAPVTLNWDLTMETSQEPARKLTFKNDGNTDLIYATKTVQSAGVGEKNDAVALEFNHLLSKVKLSFTNGFPTNATVALTNIKMQTPENASINLAAAEPAWTTVDKKTFEFSAVTMNATASADVEEYFIVPAEAVITFDLAVSVGTETVYRGSKSATLPAEAFEMGHAYKLTAEINADALNFDEIKFTVEGVNEWVEAGNDSDAAANLLYAAQMGGKCTLTEDVVLDEPLAIPAGVELVLDLGGNTIEASLKETGRHHYAIDNYGTLTLKNGTIIARGVENFGTMVIEEGVTITNIDTNGGSAIWNEGDLVINGGTFTTNAEAGVGSYGSALNTQKGGTAVVNGGNFVANSQLTYAICNYGETVINNATVVGKHGAVAAAEGAEIKTVINGGSFSLNENPAVSDHCVYYVSEIKGGTFTLGANTDSGAQVFYASTIAEGYKAVEENGVYTVGLAIVATTDALQAAINEGQSPIYLAANTTFEGTVVMKSNITIEGLEGSTMHCVNLFGADNVTLKNITFDVTNAKMGYDDEGVAKMPASIITGDNNNSANKGAHNLIIDGCTFTGTSNNGATIAFTDFHRTEGYSGNITIKNCTFKATGVGGDIYAHYTGDSANGHGNFVIENNTFETSGFIYLGRYASNIPVVLKNNTFKVATNLDDAIYVQDHSNYGVSVDASNNTFAN